MEIKRITNNDTLVVEKIVSIHLKVLNESFLNNFGPDFLKIIYSNLIETPEVVCLILYESGNIEGFALGTTDYSLFFSNALKKNKLKLFGFMLKSFLHRPVNLYKLLISTPNLLFSKETKHAELQFLGVSPSYQGKGFGSALIKNLDKEFYKSGISEFYVGTKADDPLSNKFYVKVGFTKKYSKKYFDKELNYYLSH